ncbi:hypothetical protein [Ruminococcus sp. HUN007]|uniref:hypothetical protein n=1 Tax=Ruminococcus sp. HUN007 TaxID=1514668 RepID=UPI00067881AD|nr:hypothetical protein [Ruminococcus sp. HUN007]
MDVIRIMTVDQEKNRKEPIIKVDKMFRILADLSGETKRRTYRVCFRQPTICVLIWGYQDILEELQSTYYIEKGKL